MRSLNFKSKEVYPKWNVFRHMSTKAQMGIMFSIMVAFMAVTLLISLVPGFVDMIDYGLSTNGLNCRGFVDDDLADGNQSYNSSIGEKSAIGCLAMKLYIPYIILGVLIAVVTAIFYSKSGQGQQQQYYGG